MIHVYDPCPSMLDEHEHGHKMNTKMKIYVKKKKNVVTGMGT
jgi:hypothetical protein